MGNLFVIIFVIALGGGVVYALYQLSANPDKNIFQEWVNNALRKSFVYPWLMEVSAEITAFEAFEAYLAGATAPKTAKEFLEKKIYTMPGIRVYKNPRADEADFNKLCATVAHKGVLFGQVKVMVFSAPVDLLVESAVVGELIEKINAQLRSGGGVALCVRWM